MMLIIGDLFSYSFSERQITIVTIATGLILLLISFKSNKVWERLMALSLIVIMIPASSYYYSIYLIPVVILFFNERSHIKSDLIIVLAFLLVFNPVQSQLQNYYIDYHLGLLLLLLLLCIRYIRYGIRFIQTKKALA